LLARVRENGLERFEVRVNVAEDGVAHGVFVYLTICFGNSLVGRNVEFVFEKF
jgi:hypothetical protein